MAREKIILIENQFSQFKKIRGYLVKEEYSVFPDEDQNCYTNFTNLVRVFLNERYGGLDTRDINERRIFARKEIKKIIGKYEPALLILDHILIGPHTGKTGIYLAKKLREDNITAPILFLSRIETNNPSIKEFQHIKEPKMWAHKGFSGEKILLRESFKEIVLDKIPLLIECSKSIKMSKIEEIREKIIFILNLRILKLEQSNWDTIEKALNKILEDEDCSEIQKRAIKEFNVDPNEDDIKIFIKYLKND